MFPAWHLPLYMLQTLYQDSSDSSHHCNVAVPGLHLQDPKVSTPSITGRSDVAPCPVLCLHLPPPWFILCIPLCLKLPLCVCWSSSICTPDSLLKMTPYRWHLSTCMLMFQHQGDSMAPRTTYQGLPPPPPTPHILRTCCAPTPHLHYPWVQLRTNP